MSNYTTENLVPVLNPENGIPAIRIGDQVFTMAAGGVDVSDTTATAATVLSGYYFYNSSGVKTSGSIQTVTASASGNVVTVPAGYIASSQTLTIGTAVASQTITPGTTDQTIAADSYLSGAITVKGDANLVSANIADGATIFGVTGTHKGATDFYKCASVDTVNETWTGYKAVLSNGVYSFESTVTSGLTYTSPTPEVGKVYDSSALVKASLYQGIFTGNLMNAPMDSNITTEGQSLATFADTVTYNVTTDGITGALIERGSVRFELNSIPQSFTLSGWVKATSVTNSPLIALGNDRANQAAAIWLMNGQLHIEYASGGSSAVTADTPENWHHYALTKSGSTFTLYVDGVAIITDTNASNNITDPHVYISGFGSYNPTYPDYTVGQAYYSYVRLHDYALTAAEIAQLAAEFTPSAS